MKNIKKLFRQYIVIVVLISGTFLILVSALFGLFVTINQQRNFLNYLIIQTISVLEEKQDTLEEFEEQIKQDYLIRTRALEEMIAENPDIIENQEKLMSIANLLSVDELHVISEDGIIIGSSLESYSGLDFNMTNQSQQFLFLLDSNDMDASYIQEISNDKVDQEEIIQIGVKCRSFCGFIQIGIHSNALQSYQNQASINMVLDRLPIYDGHLLLALNRQTGDLIGYSKEYESHVPSLENQLTLLESASGGKWMKIDDTPYYVVTQSYDDLLLIAMSNGQFIYHQVAWLVGLMTFITLSLVILVLKVITYLIDKSLVKDVNQILEALNQIKSGSFDIQIAKMRSEELSQISHAVNQIIKMIKTFNNKLIHIIDATKLPMVLFEHVESLDQVFITENICDLFELNQKEFYEMKSNSKKFRTFLSQIKQNPLEGHEDIYELQNGKYVKVTTFDDEHEMYGIIQDMTCIVSERKNMMCELDENRRLARTDYLTGVLNKMAVYEKVSTYLAANQVGVLLLFDLDNFKLVNDTKGHIEGDYVLQLFAKTIQSEFRENDVVGRLGGDEFVVFLPVEMTKQHLEMKLTKLIDRIRCVFKAYYISCGLSISIGSAKVTSEINTFNQLYVAADQRLYIAKKSGKDKFYID